MHWLGVPANAQHRELIDAISSQAASQVPNRYRGEDCFILPEPRDLLGKPTPPVISRR